MQGLVCEFGSRELSFVLSRSRKAFLTILGFADAAMGGILRSFKGLSTWGSFHGMVSDLSTSSTPGRPTLSWRPC